MSYDETSAAKRFAQMLEEMGDVEIQFGLRQQGHLDTVTRMRAEGASWDDIGKAIGWHGPTVQEWYEMETKES